MGPAAVYTRYCPTQRPSLRLYIEPSPLPRLPFLATVSSPLLGERRSGPIRQLGTEGKPWQQGVTTRRFVALFLCMRAPSCSVLAPWPSPTRLPGTSLGRIPSAPL